MIQLTKSPIETFKKHCTRSIIKEKIQAALNDLDIPGIKVSLIPGGSYSDTTFKMKIEAAVVGADGNAQTSEMKEWKAYCNQWGFKENDLGKRFMLRGRTLVTLTGCKASRYKYPLNIKRVDTGTEYKCSPRDLERIKSNFS